MKPNILLINPPIYDFTAYDFWLKPLGMLSVAGKLAHSADFKLFDFLNRTDHSNDKDPFNRGPFQSQIIPTPAPLKHLYRRYRRFGSPRQQFRDYLRSNNNFDYAFIQTVMTWWYLGPAEVIEDIKHFSPNTKIILGGPYATICPDHAYSIGADLVIQADNLQPLWNLIGTEPDHSAPPLWKLYDNLKVGAIKLTTGCPCKCTYCFVPKYFPKFQAHPTKNRIAELKLMLSLGVKDIAFYDDALLHQPNKALLPFMEYIIQNNISVNLHTPNALHARLLTPDIAKLMVTAGMKTFYLGYESSSEEFQKATGQKIFPADLNFAVKNLLDAGAPKNSIIAYEILGHPNSSFQNLKESMYYANSLGIRVMLADFSPIPGTIDGDSCSQYVDLTEPLNHNKTAFPYKVLGKNTVNEMKILCKKLNKILT